jgi:hypothetical protein
MHMSEWFKKFRGRCRYLKDDPESGDLSTAWNDETVAKVCEVVSRDCRMILKLMEDQLHINFETICQILQEYFRNREIHMVLSQLI